MIVPLRSISDTTYTLVSTVTSENPRTVNITFMGNVQYLSLETVAPFKVVEAAA